MKTPQQRVGIVLVVISAALWLMTALHWNITVKPFFYGVPKMWREKGPEPIGKPGMRWVADESAWELIDQECMTRFETGPNMVYREALRTAGVRWPRECIKETQMHQSHFYTERHQSLGEYGHDLVSSEGDYFWLNIVAGSLFIVGLIMSSGVDVKLWKWIRFG